MIWLYVAVLGGLGATLRFALAELDYTRGVPLGTLIVNVSGSFLAGLMFALIFKLQHHLGPNLSTALMVGFLGGLTTFSSFSLETVKLFQAQHFGLALGNIVLNLLLSLTFCYLGHFLGKMITA